MRKKNPLPPETALRYPLNLGVHIAATTGNMTAPIPRFWKWLFWGAFIILALAVAGHADDVHAANMPHLKKPHSFSVHAANGKPSHKTGGRHHG